MGASRRFYPVPIANCSRGIVDRGGLAGAISWRKQHDRVAQSFQRPFKSPTRLKGSHSTSTPSASRALPPTTAGCWTTSSCRGSARRRSPSSPAPTSPSSTMRHRATPYAANGGIKVLRTLCNWAEEHGFRPEGNLRTMTVEHALGIACRSRGVAKRGRGVLVEVRPVEPTVSLGQQLDTPRQTKARAERPACEPGLPSRRRGTDVQNPRSAVSACGRKARSTNMSASAAWFKIQATWSACRRGLTV